VKYVKSYCDGHANCGAITVDPAGRKCRCRATPAASELLAAYNTASAGSGPSREPRRHRIKDALKALIEAFDHMREHPPSGIDFAARKADRSLLDDLEELEQRDNKSSNRVAKSI